MTKIGRLRRRLLTVDDADAGWLPGTLVAYRAVQGGLAVRPPCQRRWYLVDRCDIDEESVVAAEPTIRQPEPRAEARATWSRDPGDEKPLPSEVKTPALPAAVILLLLFWTCFQLARLLLP